MTPIPFLSDAGSSQLLACALLVLCVLIVFNIALDLREHARNQRHRDRMIAKDRKHELALRELFRSRRATERVIDLMQKHGDLTPQDQATLEAIRRAPTLKDAIGKLPSHNTPRTRH